ncbi:hypothetical protein D1872_177920 [compost metagenome]
MGILCLPCTVGGQRNSTVLQILIDLPQIVKADFRFDCDRTVIRSRRRGQVTPSAIGQSFMRNPAQAFLCFFNPLSQCHFLAGLQQHRIQAREPAYCTRNIHLWQDRFPAVSLQVHQYMACACPVVHRESQRSQQQIIDLGVIGAMCLLQQLLGFSFSPLHR